MAPIAREIQAPCIVVRGFTGKRFNSTNRVINYNNNNNSVKFVNLEKDDDIVELGYVDNNNNNDDNSMRIDGFRDSGVEEIEVEMVESEKEEVNNKLGEVQEIRAKYRELDVKAAENRRVQVSASLESSLECLSVGARVDGLGLDAGVPHYKRLMRDLIEKSGGRLEKLSFDIRLLEGKRALFEPLIPAKKDEDVLIEPFRPLDEDDLVTVDNAFANSSRRKVLVTHEDSNITISGEVLRCLRPGAWLNDEVINLYLELLKEREKKEPKKFLKCHFFNTFFYKKLIGGRTGYDYKSVRRWTSQRKLGYSLLECDKIFVPVHKEIHWCLAVINKKEKKFQYLDSLGGIDKQVMSVLAKYIVDEAKDKNGEDIDVSAWKQEFVTDLPNQENGFDCGVFMIKYADFYSRGLGLCFSQEHMPYFRLRTAKEILKLRVD
ncbi:putative ubiquitin-like-specific protease 1B [Bidens hawaiensis]|uniref:putative ubiquitin-like-specific protease 1B n=1 Tax=Bidens hawaiensis TaxID=980011 RepID=UPI00404B291D